VLFEGCIVLSTKEKFKKEKSVRIKNNVATGQNSKSTREFSDSRHRDNPYYPLNALQILLDI